jgi:hypothetical protein
MIVQEPPPPKEHIPKRNCCYVCCKLTTTTLLTFILLVPVIFLVGAEEAYYSDKPIYRLLEESPSLREVRQELANKLNDEVTKIDAINLYSSEEKDLKKTSLLQKEESAKWENLREVADFLGYALSQHSEIVYRQIRYPSENLTSKEGSKGALKKAYNFNRADNLVLYLKKKLSKFLKNIVTRLSWKKSDDTSLISHFKNYVVSLVKK